MFKNFLSFLLFFYFFCFIVSCKEEVKNEIEYPNPVYSDKQKIELDNYNNSINSNLQDSELYSNRAKLKRECGDFFGAIDDYTKAINLEPSNYKYYEERAKIKQHNIGHLLSSIKDYVEVVKLSPYNDIAYKVLVK